MRIFTHAGYLEARAKHSDATEKLDRWYGTALKANWKKLIDVQQNYPEAEAVENFTVFNIGKQYRLIVDIRYQWFEVYIKYFLTHAEYDKGDWKNDPYFRK